MRRTVVHMSDSREVGGTEQAMLYVLAGLDHRTWRAVLLHQPAPGVEPLVDAARALGIEHRPWPLFGRVKGLAQIPHLARDLRAMKPTVVHAHLTHPLSCKFGLIAARLSGVPAVVATAQLFMELPRPRAVAVQHRVVAGSVDRYIAVSNEVASRLHERLGVPHSKLRVVYNGIPVDQFRRARDCGLRQTLSNGSNLRIVLTVARLDRQKGHPTLLEAAAAVPDALFVLAGDGAERATLERDAGARGIAHRVRFLGRRTDVPALLASCDLFVLPSFFEGLPLALLEAMAAGKPVVATAIGGTDEAVVDGETGLLVPPGNPSALAGAIRRMLDNPDLASTLAAAGQRRVAMRFSSHAMVAGVAAVYDELLH